MTFNLSKCYTLVFGSCHQIQYPWGIPEQFNLWTIPSWPLILAMDYALVTGPSNQIWLPKDIPMQTLVDPGCRMQADPWLICLDPSNVLCWFQTNLPLAALPLCRLASLAVSELQLSAATPLWLFTERQSLPSWIEFNCLRSAAVGKAARLSIYWLDAACRLVIPLRQVTLAQLNKYHHQSGNAASGKLVWNQHYAPARDSSYQIQ